MILHDFGWAPRSLRTPVAAYLLPDGADPDPRDHNLKSPVRVISAHEPEAQ
jgi:hypothetical protein